jgi:hypothetical protein
MKQLSEELKDHITHEIDNKVLGQFTQMVDEIAHEVSESTRPMPREFGNRITYVEEKLLSMTDRVEALGQCNFDDENR